MKNTKKIFLIIFTLSSIVTFAPLEANAQCPRFGPDGLACPILSCSGFSAEFASMRGGLPACTNLCQFVELVQRATYFGINLAVFVLAPIFITWGAIMIILGGRTLEETGAGKVSVARGKKIVMSAVVGLLLAMGAFLIVNTFFWAIGSANGFAGATWPDIICEVLP